MVARKTLYITYILSFVFYAHSYLPMYIHSSFLESIIAEKWVGLLFSIASIIGIIFLAFSDELLRKFGNLKTMFWGSVIQTLLFLALAFSQNILFLLLIFVLSQALVRVLLFNIDIFLESNTSNEETGGVRGIFLTLTSAALVIMPLFSGFLAKGEDYFLVYLGTAVLLLPVLLLLGFGFNNFKDPYYEEIPFWRTLSRVIKNTDLRVVFLTQLFLRMFYAVMVVYAPIYLHRYIGFDWEILGIMFTIMLLPFVLFELPLGKLADKFWGEKEIMSIGFLIAGLATSLVYFYGGSSIALWTIILFLTRSGASAIEIMSETYFFKKIDSSNSDIIGFFRMIGPLAYIVAPLVASTILIFGSIKILFLLTSLMLLWGMRYSLTLRDTL